jgi:tetratricopeptide (TPR) repeat protein
MKAHIVNRTMALVIALCCLNGATAFAAEPDTNAVAREHYQRGVAAFKANRFSEAGTEFRTAYETLPAYAVLYNIGQVDVALGDAVGAVDAFEKYLKDGGNAVTKERRRAVQTELEKQRARIGTIALRVQPEGAEIRVDGKLIGKAPLGEPLRLTEGKRAIVVIAPGFDTQVRELEVAPKSQMELEIKLDRVGARNDDPPIRLAPPPTPALPAASSQPSVAPVIQPSPSPPKAESETSTGDTQRTLGYVVGAAGIAAAGTGLVLAVTSVNQANDAKNRMASAQTGSQWDPAKADYDSDKSRNNLGWAALGLGTAALASGVVLVATAPSKHSGTAWTVAPWKTPNAGGLTALATW